MKELRSTMTIDLDKSTIELLTRQHIGWKDR